MPNVNSKSKEILDGSLLGELYKSRWEQIRHVNELDQRSIVMVGSALAGLIAVYPQVAGLSSNFAGALSLLAAVISYGSITSVIHNRLNFEYCISSIDQMEKHFNEIYPGLFPMAGNYMAPRNYREFSKRILSSIRGSIIATFSVALGETIFLGLSPIFNILLPSPYNTFT